MAKGKGINPFEQHVEKIVLGVVGVVFLGVVAMQFVGGTTKVSVENQDLDPDAAMTHIGRKASTLIAEVNDKTPTLPEAPTLGIEQAWRQGLAVGEPVEVAQLLRHVGPGSTSEDIGDGPVITGDFKYPELAIASPDKPLAVSFPHTLDPFEVASNPEIREIVPPSQPFDIAAISVEASFDAQALREKLAEDPDGDGRDFSRIPGQWWRDNVEILEVHLERADALDDAGNPVNLTRVGTLPGRESLMDLMEIDRENMTVDDANELVGFAREEAALVREPRFYRSIAGAPWMAPSDFAKLDEIEARQSDITRLVRRYDAIEQELATLYQQLADAGGQQRRTNSRDPGGGGGHGLGPDRPTGTPNAPDSRIVLIERRIDERVLQQQKVKLELEDLGVDETGKPIVTDPDQEFIDPLLDADTVRILAHDVRVEPGKSYIYRMRVVVNNPLFGHGQQLHEQQRHLASDPTIVGDWSAWSDPVSVLNDRYFFVTGANEAGLVGGPNATVEVYQFWYGYWRKGNTNIEPGDVIATDLRLPDANLLPIFDMAQINAALDSRRDARRPDPHGGGGHGVGLFDPRQDPADEVLPENATPAERLPPVQMGYVLLDVATIPGSEGRNQTQRAVFRGQGGQLVTRIPRADTSQALYERVKASAAEGLRQGRPEPEPEPEDPIRTPIRRTPPPSAPDDPGGPGGG